VTVVLRCTVRGCGEALTRHEGRWICAEGHSFDQHRTGFLNLLQPQDRRSKHPGDSKEAARARRRLAEAGAGAALYEAVAHHLGSKARGKPASVLDVGCGEGALLRHLASDSKLERHGVDISAPSIELAAKATPGVFFVVANADRALPFADRSFDFLISIDARVNGMEFDRVLKPGGLVIVAVPAPDDLIELRERVLGGKVEKSRVLRIEEALGKSFEQIERTTVRDRRHCEHSILRDLLTATYRGFRRSERAAVESLGAMEVTFSHEVLALKRP
jgi:23S rRNA (guanine745-N1)-methyltransferase